MKGGSLTIQSETPIWSGFSSVSMIYISIPCILQLALWESPSSVQHESWSKIVVDQFENFDGPRHVSPSLWDPFLLKITLFLFKNTEFMTKSGYFSSKMTICGQKCSKVGKIANFSSKIPKSLFFWIYVIANAHIT